MPGLTLTLLPGRSAVCRLDASAEVPVWAFEGAFSSVTRTADELSVICPEADVPGDVLCEKGWTCLKVEGPLDFLLIGVLASLAGALADAGIALFALSTYDTDYLLVKAHDLGEAITALTEAGHTVLGL